MYLFVYHQLTKFSILKSSVLIKIIKATKRDKSIKKVLGAKKEIKDVANLNEFIENGRERFKDSADGVDLSNAEVIVSIGRGVGKVENIEQNPLVWMKIANLNKNEWRK